MGIWNVWLNTNWYISHYLSQEGWTAMGQTLTSNCKIAAKNQRQIVFDRSPFRSRIITIYSNVFKEIGYIGGRCVIASRDTHSINLPGLVILLLRVLKDKNSPTATLWRYSQWASVLKTYLEVGLWLELIVELTAPDLDQLRKFSAHPQTAMLQITSLL